MPRFGPIKRRDLIRYLRRLGFEGPYSGGKHQFMSKGEILSRSHAPAWERERKLYGSAHGREGFPESL